MSTNTQDKNISNQESTNSCTSGSSQVIELYSPKGDNEFPLLGICTLSKSEKRVIDENNNEKLIEKDIEPTPTVKDMSKLTCTKPCKNVTDPYESTKTYGVCTRSQCSFAHSLQEQKLPECSFGDNCRFIHGRYESPDSKKKVPGSQCKFHHPKETRDEWIRRANIVMPSLPETSAKSRKPDAHKPDTHSTGKESVAPQPFRPVSVKLPPHRKEFFQYPPPLPPRATNQFFESPPPPLPPRSTNQFFESPPPLPPRATNQFFESPPPPPPRTTNLSSPQDNEKKKKSSHSRKQSSSSDESSSSDDSDEESTRRYRKRNRDKKSSKDFVQIIRVPAELAEMAIKAAFDRGVFNIKVVVE